MATSLLWPVILQQKHYFDKPLERHVHPQTEALLILISQAKRYGIVRGRAEGKHRSGWRKLPSGGNRTVWGVCVFWTHLAPIADKLAYLVTHLFTRAKVSAQYWSCFSRFHCSGLSVLTQAAYQAAHHFLFLKLLPLHLLLTRWFVWVSPNPIQWKVSAHIYQHFEPTWRYWRLYCLGSLHTSGCLYYFWHGAGWVVTNRNIWNRDRWSCWSSHQSH